MAAIRTVKSIEAEQRPTTVEERQALAQFAGFGALALSIFPNPATGSYRDAGWQALGEELKSLLTPAEYDWLDRQPAASIWTSSVGVFEIEYGLQTLPSGKRRMQLQQAFDQTLKQDLEGRILPLDGPAAQQAAAIAARQKAVGRPVEIRDVLIAGIVASRNAELATGGVKHFADSGIGLINPWDK